MLFTEGDQLRWYTPTRRCTPITASGNGWPGSKSTAGTSAANAPTETVTPLSLVRQYVFTLTCKHSATNSEIVKTVRVTIQAPDLTANAPTIAPVSPATNTGTANEYWENTSIRISGKINNAGTAATPNGTFNNRFEWASVDPATKPGDDSMWSSFGDAVLTSSAVMGAGESGRDLKSKPDGSDSWPASISPNTATNSWYFRLCADKPHSIGEANAAGTGETNNCSTSYTTVKVLKRPLTLKNVDIKFQGAAGSVPSGASDGPVVIPYNTKGDISWTAENYSVCRGNSNGTGSTADTNWNAKTWPPNAPAASVPSTNRTSTTIYTISCDKLANALDPASLSDQVKVVPLSVTCTGDKATGFIGDTVVWKSTAQGGNG